MLFFVGFLMVILIVLWVSWKRGGVGGGVGEDDGSV